VTENVKPADVVIALFGGVRKTARAIKVAPGTVSKWQKDGLVPSKHQVPLLDAAKAARKRLTPEMLILGAAK